MCSVEIGSLMIRLLRVRGRGVAPTKRRKAPPSVVSAIFQPFRLACGRVVRAALHCQRQRCVLRRTHRRPGRCGVSPCDGSTQPKSRGSASRGRGVVWAVRVAVLDYPQRLMG